MSAKVSTFAVFYRVILHYFDINRAEFWHERKLDSDS